MIEKVKDLRNRTVESATALFERNLNELDASAFAGLLGQNI
jgi:hypothetical protein